MSGASGGKPPPKPPPGHSAIWGPTGTRRKSTSMSTGAPSYSSITSINTSVRDKKNILEVKLEKVEGSTFRLTLEETENLLKRLNIDNSHFLGVSACPEGKPVVLITLHPSVDINKFLNKNESYIVKEGVRTTTIRQEGKKDKLIKISGLHPNTKDQAVIKYLAAHGKVNTNERVIHHTFPGEQGSSLLAGKLNGERSYFVELNTQMGSYHIIDGEKVSIKYSGQEWSCARCHKFKRDCPGSAVARNCTADRILLSEHMKQHWEKIGYKPETDALNEVDAEEEVQVQVGRLEQNLVEVPKSTLASKYKSVIIRGFKADTPKEDILEVLKQQGLPNTCDSNSISRNEGSGSLTIDNLEPEDCLVIMENLHRKRFLKRNIYVTLVVSNSPSKPAISDCEQKNGPVETSEDINLETFKFSGNPGTSLPSNPDLFLSPNPDFTEFIFPPVSPNVQKHVSNIEKKSTENGAGLPDMVVLEKKRKSSGSPESQELSKKEKKLLKSEEKKLQKSMKKQEQDRKDNKTHQVLEKTL